jgi:ribulose-phosphate 3-epimerase
MIKIAPSLLACDLSRLKDEVQNLEKAGADLLHFDVMDGIFVPNITFGLPVIESVRKHSKLIFDAHLMIQDPDKYVEQFAKVGCDWLSVHVEACKDIRETIQKIKKNKMKAGVALNPGTDLKTLDSVLHEVDYVLVMSVYAGFGGQKYIEATEQRLKDLRSKNKKLILEVDGGIKVENIKQVALAGADVAVVGTGLFSNPNYKEQIQKLRAL